MRKQYLLLILVVLLPNVFAEAVSSCTNLTSSGTTYTLSQNIAQNGSTCFRVQAENVVLDCQGNSITSNNTTGTWGVYSDQAGTVVKNCIIAKFQRTIYFNASNGGRIENNTLVNTSGNAIRLEASSNNVISGNIARSSSLTATHTATPSSRTTCQVPYG